MPTLYGAPVSPFVRKTMVALAEKDIAYEHDPVLPAVAPTEFKRVGKESSPFGRIPAYRDGDLTLADSSVIIAYLGRIKPVTCTISLGAARLCAGALVRRVWR